MRSDNRLLFAALCLFWGANWLAMKIGMHEVPPFVLAATRSLGAGIAMILMIGPRPVLGLLLAAPGRVLVVAVLTNALAYAGMYWGAARMSAGLAAIVNNALTPISLLAFGLAFGQEHVTRRRLAGIVLGAVGLALLFWRRTGATFDMDAIAGLAALAAGTLAYTLGSVVSRPLLSRASPLAVGSLQMLLGGLMLVPVSALLEAPTPGQLGALLSPVVLACLAWMVIAAGVGGIWIYLRLIRDWGPVRAGMYAFVAPIVATALGALVLGERLGTLELAGGVLMLAAAGLVLPGRRDPVPPAFRPAAPAEP